MSSEVVPTGGSFLDKLNLPKILAGPAGEAVARLIGGTVDIPAAWLNRVAQGIKDNTEAKSVVSKAVAEAAADLAKHDPEVVQRAAHSLLSKELRRQTNRESIARKTIENLTKDHPAETTTPDDDWLNVFERYAEDASSDRLQDLWGRILSGQLRKPKAFSLQTLRFVSELDEQVVTLFEKWSPYIIDGDFIANVPREGQDFMDFLHLEDCGLISGAAAQLNKSYKVAKGSPNEVTALHFRFRDHLLVATVLRPVTINIHNALLTRVGREIFSITKTKGTIEPINAFVEKFPKQNVQQLHCVSLGQDRQELMIMWSKPVEQTSTQ
jgi:Protein of unknown function (DUF2806)